MVKAKKFILRKQCEGATFKPTDFKLVEEELPPLKDGEFLAEAIYLSVDPFMRAYIAGVPLESTMIGTQVAKITESRNSKFPVGKYVIGTFGWRTHTITNGEYRESDVPTTILPDFGELPLSLALGVLGMPGNTAYFGFLEVCEPKSGETVVISGAAGAVGSHVGQIAKIIGCKVIGITGSDEKGKRLTKELGFDYSINYKTQDIEKELKRVAPEGVDYYFDNVGGEISHHVMSGLKTFGRISVCGAMSGYDGKHLTAPPCQGLMIPKQLVMQGFYVLRWADRWLEGINQNLEWIKEGKLKYKETVTNGFHNMVNALNDLLVGGNFGKAVVKV